MRRTVPSLSALLAFEAAGRLKSFTQAAAELFVTQGAVSRQIRGLEDEMGIALFTRLTRRVELTDAGRTYLREIQFVFDNLERATVKFKAQREHTILTISVLPSVASFWIMPRLGGFTKRHPDIETRIMTSIRPVDLHAMEADVAIRVGALPGKHYEASQPRIDLEMVSNWRNVRADALFTDVLVPVYSPKLLGDRPPIAAAEHLLSFPLIHTSSRIHAWPDWLRAHGLDGDIGDSSIQYGHFFMSLEAARKGEGIAIVPNVLLMGADQSGLVAPPLLSDIASAGEYYLLSLFERSGERHIVAFREWLMEEIGQSRENFASQHP